VTIRQLIFGSSSGRSADDNRSTLRPSADFTGAPLVLACKFLRGELGPPTIVKTVSLKRLREKPAGRMSDPLGPCTAAAAATSSLLSTSRARKKTGELLARAAPRSS